MLNFIKQPQFFKFWLLVQFKHTTEQLLVWHDHLVVPVPHAGQVAPAPGHQDGGDQGEGDQVEQGGLGRVHQEQGDEGRHQAQDVGYRYVCHRSQYHHQNKYFLPTVVMAQYNLYLIPANRS